MNTLAMAHVRKRLDYESWDASRKLIALSAVGMLVLAV